MSLVRLEPPSAFLREHGDPPLPDGGVLPAPAVSPEGIIPSHWALLVSGQTIGVLALLLLLAYFGVLVARVLRAHRVGMPQSLTSQVSMGFSHQSKNTLVHC